MIYAELTYPSHYSDEHDGLVAALAAAFDHLESGLQGDSWIWIFDGDNKVAVDTFTSMQHQVKSSAPDDSLARKVIEVLAAEYELMVYPKPELEAHE